MVGDETKTAKTFSTTPGISHQDTNQRAVYVRDETWYEFKEKTSNDIKSLLSDAGIVEVESQEIHEAVLTLASENYEEIAELIAACRDNNL